MSGLARAGIVSVLLLTSTVHAADLDPLAAASLAADVATLTAPGMDGRASGTPGGDRAARQLAEWLAAAGWRPGGSDGSFLQPFDLDGGARAANVVGILPGRDPVLAAEAIVIGAHWDHDGRVDGVVYPGADDNASGVAVVVGLARTFARAGSLARTLVVVFFGAEELGLLGSRHYLAAPVVPLARTVAMLNFDQVGRLREPLHVGGVDSGSGLRQLVREAARGSAPGLRFRAALDLPSDHARFHRAGIPVLFFFTGWHPDQHRATDTAVAINAAGMSEIARLAAGVVQRLGREPRPVFGGLGRRPLLVPLAGGLLLGAIAFALLRAPRAGAGEASTLWMAAWAVAVVHAATDIEVVLFVTAWLDDRLSLALGAGAATLPLVAWGGSRLAGLGRRQRWLTWAAAGALVYLGARMLMGDRLVSRLLAEVDDAVLAAAPLLATAGVIALGWWQARRAPAGAK
jgi:hypothetical protein